MMHRITKILMVAIAMVAGTAAWAQQYPDRPIHLVVPYPPGGSADVLARLLGQKLAERLGQSVIVENKAGAGTAIGARAVATSTSDGYTLLMGTVSSHAINPAMNNVGYDPVADFTPITRLASIQFVLIANPAVPVSNLADMVRLAKEKPRSLSYSSAGPGTSNHLAGELFSSAANVELLHVPYRGSSPALQDLVGGQVDLMFDLLATAEKYVNAGKVKALAVTGVHRSELLPNVPTVAESGYPGFEVNAWFGLFAPSGVPRTVVDKLNAHTVAVIATPEFQERLRGMGAVPETGTASAFAAFVRSESDKWGGVVKRIGLAGKP